ncbi:hypothetical protein N8I77_011560 [Diaporthe amygdali]|uniref:Protein kinase domain-containing protein n=1 Tax=Phomopsis amygdali TaxID=1214568 RepID=A0AAD9S602_PHOAM|nr:hypothetical protein N8I77_011560 [Diaporthe amygdali]
MSTSSPDPDKPNCPYLPDLEVDISTHTAPLPFGGGMYPLGSYPWRKEKWLYSVTQTTHVITHPPLETPPSVQENTVRLVVTKSLAIGNARGAQVLLCSIIPYGEGEKTFEAVAKIYDPLYYPPFSEIGSYPLDVVGDADEDYSKEAAAYKCLERAGQTGLFAPAFFGSWTFSFPTSYKQEIHQRKIRLILIEYIPGICMRDLFVQNGLNQINATHLSEEYRLEVLAILLDGVAKQCHAGVDQRDLSPRNVIITPPPKPKETRPQRVVLIDYNISTVYELTEYGKRPSQLAKLPPNPMELFWTASLSDLAGWVPPGLCYDRRLQQEWLRSEFGGEKKVLYEPLEKELKLHETPPEELAVMQYLGS